MKNFLNKQIILSKKIILLIILVIVLITIVAIMIPRLKSNGLENLTGNEKIFGESALLDAYVMLDNPIQRLTTFKIKVKQVVKQESDERCDIGFMEQFMVTGDYSAVVDAYTFFGIRYASVNVYCDGSTTVNYF